MTLRYQIRVTGKVQGVFYRQSTKKKADEIGITGWVTNQPDGSVLIQAEGDETLLNSFIEWCRKGPIMAKVQEVSYTGIAPQASTAFTITE